MELDWTTFLLEIVNFLVLIWILHRFLYRPVLGVIERRQEGIRDQLAETRRNREEAEALEQQYHEQLAQWEQEKARKQQRLQAEMEAERKRQVEALHTELEREGQRLQAQESRRQAEFRHRAEEQALELAGRFAARLLQRVAGPELEQRLVDMALADVESLPEARRQALREALVANHSAVSVTSAYPLDQERRGAINAALGRVVGYDVNCTFDRDEALQAGLRMAVGHWVLGANLADELRFFAQARPDEAPAGAEAPRTAGAETAP